MERDERTKVQITTSHDWNVIIFWLINHLGSDPARRDYQWILVWAPGLEIIQIYWGVEDWQRSTLWFRCKRLESAVTLSCLVMSETVSSFTIPSPSSSNTLKRDRQWLGSQGLEVGKGPLVTTLRPVANDPDDDGERSQLSFEPRSLSCCRWRSSSLWNYTKYSPWARKVLTHTKNLITNHPELENTTTNRLRSMAFQILVCNDLQGCTAM